ncbi:MAG: ABC transporter ATP-binding protein [Actinobacteria bacterium]|nr:ABC transporter ATP-binding protein [Actinomycetota bacterium]
MSSPVVVTEGLTKHYGTTVGVEDLALEVEEGEIYGFLGPNGAGKTTTLRLLLGLIEPTGGKGEVLGYDIWHQSVEVKRIVGYLPGDPALYPELTGEAHIRFISKFNGHDERNGRELATRLELELDKRIEDYSRGMKQKLALVLALMKKPSVLIMDEPTNALDPLTQHVLYDLLREYRNEGTTVLFSSHNLPEIERVCSRVGIIRDGHLSRAERIEDLGAKRIRTVEVVFENEVPRGFDNIPGVSEVKIDQDRLELKLKGDINPLLRKIAQYEIVDLSFTHASLEDIFLEFYGKNEGGEPS